MSLNAESRGRDWEQFFIQNRRSLIACAMAWSGNVHDAADLIQDVLVRLIRECLTPNQPRAFVLRCIRNLAIDRKRAAERRGAAYAAACADVRAASSDSGAALEDAATIERLSQALNCLPAPQREAVVLRGIAGLTIAECAALLDRPPGSIASAYARGIDALREHMTLETSHDARRD